MSCKYVLEFDREGARRSLQVEDFTDAILCEGRVFLRRREEHSVNTAPGQCWGNYIDVPTHSWVDGKPTYRPLQLCIDDVGQCCTVTTLDSLEPLHLTCTLHIGVDADSGPSHPVQQIAEIIYDDCGDHFTAVGFGGAIHTVLIPCEYEGKPVRRVDFREVSLENVESLIISEGIEELALDFYDATDLKRLVLPEKVMLLSPADNLSSTPWFRSQRPEPIYIGDCYCGTPGGGSGGVRSLEIPEGISTVAAGADFHSYWHSIKTPSSLRSIGRLAFATCHCLEELNISEGLRSIESEAFCQCKRLKNLYLPDSLEELGVCCFDKCDYLQSVSVPDEIFVENFCVHAAEIRRGEGKGTIEQCPPLAVSLSDRVRAFPKGAPFTAAGKEYRHFSEFTVHRLDEYSSSYLDVHGRKTWLMCILDDCFKGIVTRRYIKENGLVTQIEETADGTVLVREGISPIDTPYVVRPYLGEVFGAE